jgi:transposase-like protein
MPKRRSFTPEFKAEAITLAIEQRNITKTARELGISSSALGRWVREHNQVNEEHGMAVSAADTIRIAEMEREMAQLRKENEFLKKAAAFFAKNQPM